MFESLVTVENDKFVNIKYFQDVFGWDNRTRRRRINRLLEEDDNLIEFWDNAHGQKVSVNDPEFNTKRKNHNLQVLVSKDGCIQLPQWEKNNEFCKRFRKFVRKQIRLLMEGHTVILLKDEVLQLTMQNTALQTSRNALETDLAKKKVQLRNQSGYVKSSVDLRFQMGKLKRENRELGRQVAQLRRR